MQCSIILVAYHGDQWMPKCIQTLAESVPKKTHLVIVDNSGNSVIGALDLSHFVAEIIQSEQPLGFAEANNYALVNARALGEYLVFLNQDTQSRDDWLAACIKCLHSDPDIAAVTPMTRTYNWQGWDPYFMECAHKSDGFARDMDAGEPLQAFYELPVIPAAAMVVRREVLEQVGPFDPIFFSYYEDYDLCHRIRSAGFKVGVCTSGAVAHFSGSATNTPAAERRRARWVSRNRVIFAQRVAKGNRFLLLMKYFLTTFPRGILRSILKRPMAKPLIPYLQAHWDLLKLFHRLVSEPYDRLCWNNYLAAIGWPPAKAESVTRAGAE